MATIHKIAGNFYVRFRDSTRQPTEKTVPIDEAEHPTELYRMGLEVKVAMWLLKAGAATSLWSLRKCRRSSRP